MKSYYRVYRDGFLHHGISHTTLESATSESERLAAMNPGESFEILQCVGITRTSPPSPQTFWMDGVVPPLAIPSHLPPLPPVPDGYSRWEYRGMGWKADDVTYSCCHNDGSTWSYVHTSDKTANSPDHHYVEAIKEVTP